MKKNHDKGMINLFSFSIDCIVGHLILLLQGVSYAFEVLNSQQATLKVKSEAITDLEGNYRIAAEKQAMDEELVGLRPLRQHANELNRLRKELEERDSELSRVGESKKKDSELELALEKLRKSNFTI